MSARPAAVPAPPTRERLARLLLAAFLLVALCELVSLALGRETGHLVAKPLLMPLLAAYTAVRGGPPLLTGALLFGWGGDVLLMFDADGAFLAGMGFFAAGHVCYLVLFRRGRPQGLLGAVYVLILAVTVALLWPGLPAELRVPVAGYSLLLTAMAWRAGGLGPLAGAGGALFLLSDTLIAAGIADWPRPPAPDFWIMLSYLAAQSLLAAGSLRHGSRARARARAYGAGRATG
ncbi:lysoplasmalogenase [Streptomyces sp. NPDC058391]|uniref:lysoplasmalogenase n=1 Tax=Streptomyces sp. NPDC058391 TaxID=3346476 RepID=UPI0036648405